MKKLLFILFFITAAANGYFERMNLFDAEFIIEDLPSLTNGTDKFDKALKLLTAVKYCEKNKNAKAITLDGHTTKTCVEIAEIIKVYAKKKKLSVKTLCHPQHGPVETRLRMANSYANIMKHYL